MCAIVFVFYERELVLLRKILLKMEGTELVMILTEVFRSKRPLGKKQKKKICRFFECLCGGDSPLEAVELALRRNRKLQTAQLRALSDILQFVEDPPETNGEGISKSLLLHLLFHCRLMDFLLRLLQLRLPDGCITEDGIEWKSVYHKSLFVIKYLIEASEKTEQHIEQVIRGDAIETILDFCDDGIDVIAVYPAVYSLKSLCLMNYEACERILFSNGLPKLGSLILKDTCQKMLVRAYRGGMKSYQLHALEHFYEKNREQFKSLTYKDQTQIPYNVVLRWSENMQVCCALIILKIADQNDRHRKIVFEDKITSKALITWLETPAIMPADCMMIEACVRIIGILCYNEEIAWKLIDSYDLIVILECGGGEVRGQRFEPSLASQLRPVQEKQNIASWPVEAGSVVKGLSYSVKKGIAYLLYGDLNGQHFLVIPERDTLASHLEVMLQLAARGGRCRCKILENVNILKALAKYIYSFNQEVQETTLRIFCSLVDGGNQVKAVIHCGLNAKALFILTDYHDTNASQKAAQLKKSLSKACPREWKRDEASFAKTRKHYTGNLRAERARIFKDAGNEKFKMGEYEEAAKLYTEALDYAAPSLEFANGDKKGRKWWVLPAVLYSNRAQCYLKNEQWTLAVNDCSEAIARCLEDDDEAKKMLMKTAYRRAKALLEEKDYQKAINDIAFCLRKDYRDENIKALYNEIIAKYRKYVGVEPIRRCGACCGGEGEKLKRCADCHEVYCSRRCQLQDWENGHRNFCRGKI